MQSVILLESWRQDRIADKFGVMQWRDTGSLGRIGREDEKMGVDLCGRTTGQSSAWEWMTSQLGAYS